MHSVLGPAGPSRHCGVLVVPGMLDLLALDLAARRACRAVVAINAMVPRLAAAAVHVEDGLGVEVALGRGLPADEHEKVLGRFARGSTAAPGGSGLGLALVAQQAALHGGAVELSDGPLGGLRARLTVSTTPEQVPGAGES